MSVHFSDKHYNYYTAFKYINKNDENVYTSQGHRNLKEIGMPQTIIKIQKRKQNSEQQNEQNSKNKKTCRLSNWDVSEFMAENNIKSETELFAIADEQKKTGKKDLANSVLSCSMKALSDLKMLEGGVGGVGGSDS